MRAHTITTKPRDGARGRMKRTIVPGGILALSLAVVLFAAMASSAGAGSGQYLSEGGPSATNGAEPRISRLRTPSETGSSSSASR